MADDKKTHIVGYGLYYRANNALIGKTTDRIVFQTIIDIVRKQLSVSLHNQTVFLESSSLGRYAGVDSNHTLPSVLKRLEGLGLIELHPKAFLVKCDEYVALVKHYESLKDNERSNFAKDFQAHGMEVLKNYSISVKPLCREELLGMVGTSMKVNSDENCKITENRDNDAEKTVILQSNCNFTEELHFCNLSVKLQKSLQLFAEKLHFYSRYCNFTELENELSSVKLQKDEVAPFKYAFETGVFPDDTKINADFNCNFTVFATVILQFLPSKLLKNYSTDINKEYKRKNYERSSQKKVEKSSLSSEKGEEDFPLKPLSHVEDETSSSSPVMSNSKKSKFVDKVEVPDFSSEEDRDDYESSESRSSQKVKRDYGFSNPYRNKPFLSETKLELISRGWQDGDTITSPAKFFLWMLYWGLFEYYADMTKSEEDVDEYGNEVELPEEVLKERMKHPFPMPKDELSQLLDNICEDMDNAVDNGFYEAGGYKYKIGFDKNHGINPDFIFDWDDTFFGRDIPAYRVDITKFRDIEAKDASEAKTPQTKEEKRLANRMNRAYLAAISQADDSQLTELERMMRDFANTFFVYEEGREYEVRSFLNDRGLPMEGDELPAWIIKPWAVKHSTGGIHQNDLYEVFNADNYSDGQPLHRKPTMFSFAKAKRWYEMHGVKSQIIEELQSNRPDN